MADEAKRNSGQGQQLYEPGPQSPTPKIIDKGDSFSGGFAAQTFGNLGETLIKGVSSLVQNTKKTAQDIMESDVEITIGKRIMETAQGPQEFTDEDINTVEKTISQTAALEKQSRMGTVGLRYKYNSDFQGLIARYGEKVIPVILDKANKYKVDETYLVNLRTAQKQEQMQIDADIASQRADFELAIASGEPRPGEINPVTGERQEKTFAELVQKGAKIRFEKAEQERAQKITEAREKAARDQATTVAKGDRDAIQSVLFSIYEFQTDRLNRILTNATELMAVASGPNGSQVKIDAFNRGVQSAVDQLSISKTEAYDQIMSKPGATAEDGQKVLRFFDNKIDQLKGYLGGEASKRRWDSYELFADGLQKVSPVPIPRSALFELFNSIVDDPQLGAYLRDPTSTKDGLLGGSKADAIGPMSDDMKKAYARFIIDNASLLGSEEGRKYVVSALRNYLNSSEMPKSAEEARKGLQLKAPALQMSAQAFVDDPTNLDKRDMFFKNLNYLAGAQTMLAGSDPASVVKYGMFLTGGPVVNALRRLQEDGSMNPDETAASYSYQQALAGIMNTMRSRVQAGMTDEMGRKIEFRLNEKTGYYQAGVNGMINGIPGFITNKDTNGMKQASEIAYVLNRAAWSMSLIDSQTKDTQLKGDQVSRIKQWTTGKFEALQDTQTKARKMSDEEFYKNIQETVVQPSRDANRPIQYPDDPKVITDAMTKATDSIKTIDAPELKDPSINTVQYQGKYLGPMTGREALIRTLLGETGTDVSDPEVAKEITGVLSSVVMRSLINKSNIVEEAMSGAYQYVWDKDKKGNLTSRGSLAKPGDADFEAAGKIVDEFLNNAKVAPGYVRYLHRKPQDQLYNDYQLAIKEGRADEVPKNKRVTRNTEMYTAQEYTAGFVDLGRARFGRNSQELKNLYRFLKARGLLTEDSLSEFMDPGDIAKITPEDDNPDAPNIMNITPP